MRLNPHIGDNMTFLQYLIEVKNMREKTAKVYNLAFNSEDMEKYKSSRKRALRLHKEYEYHLSPSVGQELSSPALEFGGLNPGVAIKSTKRRHRRMCEGIQAILNIETTSTKRIRLIRILLGRR